jgi:DNA primase
MLDLYRFARMFYRDQLMVRPYEWAARHLRHHGLGHAMEANTGWKVGYASDESSHLVERLRWLEFDDEYILASGLAVAADNGHLVDRSRDCLMFVARDPALAEVGFVGQGRHEVTYLDTPESAIHRKSETLIGVAEQEAELKNGAVPVVADGPMAALAISAAGGDAAEWAGVAVRDAAMTRLQASFLRHYSVSDSVVVALGGDAARRLASAELLSVLEKEFSTVLVAELPEERDPRTLHVAANDPFDLRAALMNARPLASLAIDLELARWSPELHDVAGRLGAMRSVARFVLRLPGTSVGAELSRISKRLQLDAPTMAGEVQRARTTRSKARTLGPADGSHEPESPTPLGPAF